MMLFCLIDIQWGKSNFIHALNIEAHFVHVNFWKNAEIGKSPEHLSLNPESLWAYVPTLTKQALEFEKRAASLICFSLYFPLDMTFTLITAGKTAIQKVLWAMEIRDLTIGLHVAMRISSHIGKKKDIYVLRVWILNIIYQVF